MSQSSPSGSVIFSPFAIAPQHNRAAASEETNPSTISVLPSSNFESSSSYESQFEPSQEGSVRQSPHPDEQGASDFMSPVSVSKSIENRCRDRYWFRFFFTPYEQPGNQEELEQMRHGWRQIANLLRISLILGLVVPVGSFLGELMGIVSPEFLGTGAHLAVSFLLMILSSGFFASLLDYAQRRRSWLNEVPAHRRIFCHEPPAENMPVLFGDIECLPERMVREEKRMSRFGVSYE
jgi:hypothetical protein